MDFVWEMDFDFNINVNFMYIQWILQISIYILFFHSTKLLASAFIGIKILQGPSPSAPNKSLSTTVPFIFWIFARPAHGFLFIAPASWAANHLAKPTEHSRINFRQYVYVLTKWPVYWQTDLLPDNLACYRLQLCAAAAADRMSASRRPRVRKRWL